MKNNNPVKPILLSIFLLLNILSAYTQQVTCGFDLHHRALLKNNSFYKKAIVENERRVKTLLTDKDFLRTDAPVYTIPVVVHVIHNGEAVGFGSNISDAQIQSAITSLTQYYRGAIGSSFDAELEFRLASLDSNCNPTNGIVRVNGSAVAGYSTSGMTLYQNGGNELNVKNLSRWGNDYYNIWVVSEIENNNGGSGIQGFAYFPGGGFPAFKDLDGTVVLASSFGYDPGGTIGYALKGYTNLNTTLVHEMAHALGIYHTFEGQLADTTGDGFPECPPPGSCTSTGDMVCDTDPHVQSNSNCPGGTNSCNGDPNSDIVHNFMDYSSEACKNNFTNGQVTRMRGFLTSLRPQLINSVALSAASPVSPYVPPVAAAFTPNTVNMGGDFAGIYRVTLNQRTKTSDLAVADGGYLNRVASCINLMQLFRGVTYSLDVTILGFNHEQFAAWLDYNNDGDFLDAGEQLALTTHINGTGVSGQNILVSVSFTVPGTAPLNTPVRLRVMDDVSTNYSGIPDISAATHSQYGQAEDYPVYFSSLLPAVMHSFTGQLTDNHAQLQWTASIDQHTKGFDVERSYNGIDFKKVGYVSASSGQGGQPAKFIFSDGETALENNYYRLKQWDVDNRFEYSNIVLIKSAKNAGAGFSVLNNPFNNYIDIVFNKPLKENVVIRLLDIHGREIYTESIMASTDQKRRIDLSGKTLLKGVYILEVRLNDRQYSQKLIRY